MKLGYYPAPFTGAVINSLSIGGTTDALSAEQGKVLDEGKIDKTSIVNDLTTGGATSVLSAEQGKELEETKQDNLTFDDAPTDESVNPVKSGGVYTALAGKQDTLTFDETPTDESTNPVTSGGVFTALALRLLASEFGANWWSTFQDKATVLPDAVEGVITLVNRKRYYLADALTNTSTFTLAFPSSGVAVGDEIELYFMTGATVPSITTDKSNTIDYTLSLSAYKNYEVNAKYRPLTNSAGTVANGWDVAIRESTVTAV